MKALFFVFLLVAYSQFIQGQTKLISFKSHSGNMKNFKTALKKDPKMKRSNFGLPPTVYYFDTVVYQQNKGLVTVKIKNSFSNFRFRIDTIWHNAAILPLGLKDSVKNKLLIKYQKKGVDFNLDSLVFVGFGRKENTNKRK